MASPSKRARTSGTTQSWTESIDFAALPPAVLRLMVPGMTETLLESFNAASACVTSGGSRTLQRELFPEEDGASGSLWERVMESEAHVRCMWYKYCRQEEHLRPQIGRLQYVLHRLRTWYAKPPTTFRETITDPHQDGDLAELFERGQLAAWAADRITSHEHGLIRPSEMRKELEAARTRAAVLFYGQPYQPSLGHSKHLAHLVQLVKGGTPVLLVPTCKDLAKHPLRMLHRTDSTWTSTPVDRVRVTSRTSVNYPGKFLLVIEDPCQLHKNNRVRVETPTSLLVVPKTAKTKPYFSAPTVGEVQFVVNGTAHVARACVRNLDRAATATWVYKLYEHAVSLPKET